MRGQAGVEGSAGWIFQTKASRQHQSGGRSALNEWRSGNAPLERSKGTEEKPKQPAENNKRNRIADHFLLPFYFAGGKLRYLQIKKLATSPKCGDCHIALPGVRDWSPFRARDEEGANFVVSTDPGPPSPSILPNLQTPKDRPACLRWISMCDVCAGQDRPIVLG